MVYLSEFIGCLTFLLGGYAFTCNISLKKTLIGTRNYIELAVAWSISVGFGLAIGIALGGPAYLNPGVVFGSVITGSLPVNDAIKFLLMEFLAAGVAMVVCIVFFWDSFKASKGISKRGIFSAYPVEKNVPLNFVQEFLATFFFLVLILGLGKTISGPSAALQTGILGFADVLLLSLTLNSTGFSMNAMRSVFSSIWFVILPIPNKDGEKVDWGYQLIVNFVGSSIGGIAAVLTVNALF